MTRTFRFITLGRVGETFASGIVAYFQGTV